MAPRTYVSETFDHDGFSKRLRWIRRHLDMTQDDVAEKLGLVSSSVAHYELGNRLPSLMVLHDLCMLYDVAADWLFWGEDEDDA